MAWRMLEELGDSREAVSARLKKAREILGMDQHIFAAKAGLLPQTYGPYETGKRDLTLESAKKIRKAHGLTLEFMFFGKIADLPHRIAAHL
jgi:transcriptional regulator with XRE-family HTH domain